MNRRKFLKLSALSVGTVIGGRLVTFPQLAAAETSSAMGSVPDRSVKSMTFRMSYVTEILTPPQKDQEVEFWIPLGQSDSEQGITELLIDSDVAFHINEETRYNNKMVYAGPVRFKKGDRISVTYRIKRKTAGIIINEKEDIKKHLVLTEREKWDTAITMFADKVVAGENDPLEIGRKIYHALVDYLTYDKTILGCGFGNSSWTFANKAGKCDDFHALFRTMMVYKGVPVRWEQGIPLPYPSVLTKSGKFEGDCTGSHCWLRFYIGGGRWVPVDVSEADKRQDLRDYFFGTLSPNRFKISTGRGLTLNLPQKGDALNTFPFTYAETDGIPLIYGHHYRNVIQYEVLDVET